MLTYDQRLAAACVDNALAVAAQSSDSAISVDANVPGRVTMSSPTFAELA